MGWGGVGHGQIVWGHMDLLQQAAAAFLDLLLRANFYSDNQLSWQVFEDYFAVKACFYRLPDVDMYECGRRVQKLKAWAEGRASGRRFGRRYDKA
jgi:hypothetical protein